jgi:AI-2 transport protein TqsA
VGSSSGSVRVRLLAVLAAIVVAAALKATQPVTLPLAAAIFLIVLAWPLQLRLERGLPRPLAYVVTGLVVIGTLAAFVARVAWSLSVVLDRVPEFVQRLAELRADVTGWAEERELPIGDETDELGAGSMAPVIASLWHAGAMLFLTIAFFGLGLTEVRRFRARLIAFDTARGEQLLGGIREASRKVRGFVVALTLAGLIGGVASFGYALALGLEHALVWAFLAYLLNYIPVVGSTLAVFPPTLWALVQFDGVGRPLAVLIGFGAIQFVVGNYIAPHFESRFTTISPLIVLVSIVVWWWVWGPIGAVLGVPLTVAGIDASRHFGGTRWIAALLAEQPPANTSQ